jgi:hypothetical protein
MLTGGHVADCTAATALLEGLPANPMVHGDKGYDSNAVRHQIEAQGCVPNIPPKSNHKWKNCFSPYLSIPGPQCHRTHVWQAEGLQAHCHQI